MRASERQTTNINRNSFRIAHYPLAIGGKQPFVIAFHGNAGETRFVS
jgi:hypothetical protein